MERFIQWGVRRYVGGPARSWLFTTLAVYGFRAVRSAVGRKEVVDVGKVGKGKQIVVEHLPITHQKQMKDAKIAKRVAKSEAKAARKVARVARRAERAARREERAATGASPAPSSTAVSEPSA